MNHPAIFTLCLIMLASSTSASGSTSLEGQIQNQAVFIYYISANIIAVSMIVGSCCFCYFKIRTARKLKTAILPQHRQDLGQQMTELEQTAHGLGVMIPSDDVADSIANRVLCCCPFLVPAADMVVDMVPQVNGHVSTT